MAIKRITPIFVEFIPENIEDGKLYISEVYQTAIHKCCCGCGEEVVTPLSPADWQLRKVGQKVSLRPSIGNWNYRCKSHYFITENRIEWAKKFSQEQIYEVQKRDKVAKQKLIASKNRLQTNSPRNSERLLTRLWSWMKSFFKSKT